MKKIIIAFLAGIILFSFCSCEAKDIEYSYSIKDALKISAWVLDEGIENHDYWELVDETGHKTDVVSLEQLKLNEVRTMAPFHYMLMPHLNIFFEFDGIIEVETDDEYILLSYNADNPTQPRKGGENVNVASNIKWSRELYVNFCPLDEYIAEKNGVIRAAVKIGREYYLNVNAYNYENEKSPVIRAQLKFLVLEDKALTSSDLASFVDEDYSRFLSIELVSYEYSDRYKMLDEIWDDEDE